MMKPESAFFLGAAMGTLDRMEADAVLYGVQIENLKEDLHTVNRLIKKAMEADEKRDGKDRAV